METLSSSASMPSPREPTNYDEIAMHQSLLFSYSLKNTNAGGKELNVALDWLKTALSKIRKDCDKWVKPLPPPFSSFSSMPLNMPLSHTEVAHLRVMAITKSFIACYANILLDFKFEAKLDFGLAKITSDVATHVLTPSDGNFWEYLPF
ncbi:hypothetical protein L6452_13526 [Arctium lappa]|uniref:Uncharacterized protein n=1 Tax=Arctium lappa TaxID=4217 RepID=A0ACB9CIG8_ARCLA|nr:hypothetical protein L6452_13526 [Arctium lappa]